MPITINGTGPITGVTSINTSVSDTELGYLDGVTSGIQSQINTSGGLVKIVDNTFSASSAVNINNCFTSTYANYRIMVALTAASATDPTIPVYYRASGTDTTTGYQRYGYGNDGAALTVLATNDATIMVSSTTNPKNTFLILDSFAPNLAQMTVGNFFSGWVTNAGQGPRMQHGSFTQTSTTQFDGFSLVPSSGTISGTVRVYGYRN